MACVDIVVMSSVYEVSCSVVGGCCMSDVYILKSDAGFK